MTESCFDDSTPAEASNFLKLVGKYGYCQENFTIENRPLLDPCNDLYILMCFAAVQVAIGTLQIISNPYVSGKSFFKVISCLSTSFPLLKLLKLIVKRNRNKIGNSEIADDDEDDDKLVNGMGVLGAISWIAGIIMLIIYTNTETFGTSLPNIDSERFYNSFKAAVILNLVLFVIGLLVVLLITVIFVFAFIFGDGRCETLLIFIIGLIILGCPTSFFGCIIFYGWPYSHGDCQAAIESYKGPSSNNFTITLVGNVIPELNESNYTSELELDVVTLISQKLLAGPTAECLVDDDCVEKLEVCNENFCGLRNSTHDSNTYATANNESNIKNNLFECAKGRDCGVGNTCDNGTCVPNQDGQCGSKLDCNDPGLPHCESGSCVATVAALNPYGYEFGQIFYETNCELLTDYDNPSQHQKWEFFCEYVYESDAILYNILNQNLDDGDTTTDSIECELLGLQFREFQLEMVKLSVFETDGLAITNCVIESSLILPPEKLPVKT